MPPTVIRGKQVLDGSIQRADLDTSTVGQAVVAKLVQGTNVTLSSTGADSGTGDVTISVPTGGTGPAGPAGPAGADGKSVISYSTASITLPPVGSTVSVTWDQVDWMMIGLPMAVGDASGNIVGLFTITALNTTTKTTTLQRTF
jgi:hypothetical protein